MTTPTHTPAPTALLTLHHVCTGAIVIFDGRPTYHLPLAYRDEAAANPEAEIIVIYSIEAWRRDKLSFPITATYAEITAQADQRIHAY